MPRCRVIASFACVATVAVAVSGCSGGPDMFKSDAGWFSKPVDFFSRADGSGASGDAKTVSLGPRGPVSAEDLVGADGRCAPAAAVEAPQPPAQTASAAQPAAADRPVGSVAGDLAGAPMPVAAAPGQEPGLEHPPVLGGIALGMTECDAVRRAGLASNVTIGVDDKGERKTVLTYLGGNWPGIYTFNSGRLKEISRAPEPPKPAKPAPKKPARTTAKKPTATQAR